MNEKGSLVFCCDLDGTLGDYHGHFHQFAEAWLGRKLPELSHWKGEEPFWSYLGIARQTYRRIKLAYRQGGLKRSMPAYPGAALFSKTIRHHCQLWICTTRPYLQLGEVDGDTRHWLRRNRIGFDDLIWGDRKYQIAARIARRNGQRIVGALDDLPELCWQAVRVGIPLVMMYDQHYNRRIAFARVSQYAEAAAALVEEMERGHG
jgi:5' nucleotidase, deoxy (Pyrimidine), cytosolic type C protein (NT5C)